MIMIIVDSTRRARFAVCAGQVHWLLFHCQQFSDYLRTSGLDDDFSIASFSAQRR